MSMLKETGRIVAIESDALWVATIQRSSCSRCVAEKGCGQSLLARMGEGQGLLRVLLDGRSPHSCQLNQTVELGIPERVVANGSLLAYFLPLILLLVFGSIAHTLFQHELLVIGSAILGLLIGGVMLRIHSHYYRNNPHHQPVIVDSDTANAVLISN